MSEVWERRKRKLHESALYPTIRVQSDRATGSGTIIYSGQRAEPDEDGELGFSTYALTNHHVVASAIRVEKKYDPQLGKEVTRDYRDLVRVEVFDYKNMSTITSRTTADAEIVAYHEKRDLAVLRLRTNREFPNVATLYPGDKAREVHIFDPILIVGCGLGQPPFPTQGIVSGKGEMIDYYEYWMSTAPSIFGNSGGAVFLERTLELIGVPSRISVSGGMFGGSAVTHMGYFCPPNEIRKFLRDQGLHFLYDSSHSEAQDIKALAEKSSSGEDD